MTCVSVILPFFNAAATIERAVRSIQAQTHSDWELIAFDDGSEDGSGAVVEGLAREDPRIRVRGGGHAGIVEALRAACAEAQGRYLLRMDADDYAWPERIERQVAVMEAQANVALCGTRVRFPGERLGSGRRRYEEWINGLVTHEDMVRELFVECPLPHPSFCMRRQSYDAVGGYQDHGWPEDYDLVMRVWQAGWDFVKVEEPLLDWYDAPGRLSMRDPRYDEASFRRLKRHYLFHSYLKDRSVFHQWGAGEVGKRWLREWGTARPEAVVDIHPRKIGRKIHGFKVIAPEELPPPGESFVLITVGTPGARDDIRGRMAPRGYVELRDYLFLA